MKPMNLDMSRIQQLRTFAGWMIAAMLLPALAGCVAGTAVEPRPAAQTATAAQKSSVTRLADGRQGFVITEVARVNEAAHKDFQRAVAMLDKGHYDRAVDLLEKVIEQSPGVTAPHINLAIAYRRLDKLEKAEAHLQTALDMVPGHPVACNEYGLLYRQTGRFSEARAIYEAALARFPDYYPVHRNLGILCDIYLNDLQCALQHYEIYGRTRPDDQQVQLWIADLRNRLKNQ
jgi:Tfp pilus assembly protein PilF